MSTLFAVEPVFPEGFVYVEDFISQEVERQILDHLSEYVFHTFMFQGYEAKRRVVSFGYDYHFENKKLLKGKPVPDELQDLVHKVASYLKIVPEKIEEVLVTEYPVGSVINWHRDAPPFELIAGISLLSDCHFRLRPYDKTLQKRATIVSFPVRRRSLYVMQGNARENWEHSISPVKEKRYSVTFRTLKSKP